MTYDLTPVRSRAAWKGSALDYRQNGLYQLSAADLVEIDAALSNLKALGDLDLPEITRENFPLSGMGNFLANVRNELASGLGFVLIRGIDRERYSDDDLARIYYGLGTHVGDVIPQSGNGELLGHVMNVSDVVDETVRGYRSAQAMNMHSDGHDVVGLLCLREAKKGGESRIASAVAVHDKMVAERPELAELLYRGMPIARGQRDAERGDGRVVTPNDVALFNKDGETFAACVHVAQVREAAAKGAFTMTPQQEEALAMFCELSASPEFYLDMNIAPGDIQFLNNRLIIHGRALYEDHPEITRRRHLMRLWLNIPTWERRSDAQDDIYSLNDLPLWAAYRTPRMELPSVYMSEMVVNQLKTAAA